jgi:Family of unknown function (DUF5989)
MLIHFNRKTMRRPSNLELFWSLSWSHPAADLCYAARNGHTRRKKYWLLPIVLMFVLFGMLVVSQTSAIAPFIYTLFRG